MFLTTYITLTISLLDIISARLIQTTKTRRPGSLRIDNYKEKSLRRELENVVKYLNADKTLEEQNAEEGKAQGIVKILQRNAETEYQSHPGYLEPGYRIHVIKNPEVLERYVAKLRSRDTSSDSDDSGSDSYEDRIDRNIRRDARTRHKRGKAEETAKLLLRNAETEYQSHPGYLEPGYRNHVIKNPEVLQRYVAKLRSRDTSSDSDYSGSDSYEDRIDRNIRRNARTRHKRARSNEIFRNDQRQSEYTVKRHHRPRSIDALRESLESQVTPFHTALKQTDTEPAKQVSVENTWDIFTTMDKNRESSKNYDAISKNRENKERNFYKDTSTERYKLKRSDDHFRSSKNLEKINAEISDADIDKNIEDSLKNKEDWDISNIKNVDSNNDWSKVGVEDVKITKNKNAWVETTRNSYRQENRKKREKKENYVARIPEYAKVARERSGGGFYGRTPIPFVGKRGIYDDNK